MLKINKYNKETPYAFIFGAFGTIEMLKKKPNESLAVLVDPSFTNNIAFQTIKELASHSNVEIIIDNNLISKIRDKGNIFVIGVFKKYQMECTHDNHLILYGRFEPGVIGTIIRSLNGFEHKNLAIIDDKIDLFDEHLIRSSMGAFFNINIEVFKNIENYRKKFKNKLYLVSNVGNSIENINKEEIISIIFSNTTFNFDCDKICIPQDISIENKINIFLFSTYKK